MKYYKLLEDQKIIGAVCSNDFIRYSSINQCFLRGSEINGEYISFQGKLYRTTWMSSIKMLEPYSFVDTIEITEEEYQIYMEAIRSNEIIEEYEEKIEPVVIEEPIIDDGSLDFVRTAKINMMSHTCNQMIENGFDIELQDGVHHFSLTVEDQLNLMSLSSMVAQGIEQIPYHADGELCKFYTPAEITAIVNQATMWKTYHTTYFNALKAYINSLDTIEAIGAITYGIELPEEFKTDVLRAITQ